MTEEVKDLSEAEAQAEAIASFNAGSAIRDNPAPTPTPAPVVESSEAAPKEPVAEVKPFSVSEAEWREIQEVKAKVAALDDHTRQISGLAGNYGSLKQIVDGLRQRGTTKIEPAQLKRTIEAYPELGPVLAEDLSEILGAPQGAGVDLDEVDKRVEAKLATERMERTKEWLSDNFPSWEDTLRSQEFRAYQLTLTPAENTELMESKNGKVVGKYIKSFTEAKAKADALAAPKTPAATPAPTPTPKPSSRQAVIESAVPAKGDGSTSAAAPSEADEFNAGWSLKGKG